MLPARSLLLSAALAVGLVVPTAAHAVSWPVTPAVTGGEGIYSGGGGGLLKASNPATGASCKETANVDFSATSYAADLWGGTSVFDDGGASGEVKDYTSAPGSGTVTARFRHWDPVKGYTYSDLQCTNGGAAMTAPAPAHASGGKLSLGGVGFVDFATGSTCSPNDNSGKTGNGLGSQLVGAITGAQVTLGATVPAGASKD